MARKRRGTDNISDDHEDEQKNLLSRPKLAHADNVEAGHCHRRIAHEERVDVGGEELAGCRRRIGCHKEAGEAVGRYQARCLRIGGEGGEEAAHVHEWDEGVREEMYPEPIEIAIHL